MKMIIVIIKDNDAEPVTQALTKDKFRVTRVASTGGFLRRGVVTLLIGVDEKRVGEAIQVIRETTAEVDPGEKRATIFVVPVANFVQV
jgi:uncharacterized protein YaaQ